MANLPESVTMSTSGSADAGVDDGAANGGSDLTATQLLESALVKLRQGGHNVEVLPRTPNDNLWERIESTYGLSLVELVALKNHACAVVARPRGVLRRIEAGTFYRINDNRVRAQFTISNTVNMRRYILSAELLVDPGANTELKLPARKVKQLGLTPLGNPTLSRGSTNDISYNLHFFPVLVSATFSRDGVEETVQGALDVKCDKNEYDALQAQEEEESAGANNEGHSSLVTPNQPINGNATTSSSSNHEGVMTIQLTPTRTRHRPHDAPLQQAVIGMDGLRKLHLHLNCDQLQLEIEEDNLVEDEEVH